MAESQDATLLQRRARRRLVGAIALVVFVVIVFPIVLEKERKPIGQDLVIQIPSQDAGRFKTSVLPPEVSASEPNAPAPAAKAEAPATTVEVKPAKAEAKPDQLPAKAQAAAAADTVGGGGSAVAAKPQAVSQGGSKHAGANSGRSDRWAVQVGAFAEAKNAKQLQSKLVAAGLKSYVETVKVKNTAQTRVRLGPFDGKAEAEKASARAKAMGLRAELVPLTGGPGR